MKHEQDDKPQPVDKPSEPKGTPSGPRPANPAEAPPNNPPSQDPGVPDSPGKKP